MRPGWPVRLTLLQALPREPVLPPVQLDDVSKTIGGLIADIIPDGACLQLGIGAIPDATGMALKSKHDLGIHTEMFTDSMVELIECGAVNNSKKQIHRGKTVTTFAFGSQRIYDFVDDNPSVEILPVDYVNDPNVICQNDNIASSLSWAASGIGVAIAPYTSAIQNSDPTLVMKRIDSPEIVSKAHLIWNRSATLTPEQKAFVHLFD